MYYTDNPIADYDRYAADIDRELQKLPLCSHCGEPIQDDECWVIDGEIYHTHCAEELFCKWTEDYIGK